MFPDKICKIYFFLRQRVSKEISIYASKTAKTTVAYNI